MNYKITIKPYAPNIGAIITGIDLSIKISNSEDDNLSPFIFNIILSLSISISRLIGYYLKREFFSIFKKINYIQELNYY